MTAKRRKVGSARIRAAGRPCLHGGHRSTLEEILSLWREVADGGGPLVVTLDGETGCGKTRLVQELYEDLVARSGQRFWKPGLLPPGTPRDTGELRRERKIIDPEGLCDPLEPPAWLWFGVACSSRSSRRQVDEADTSDSIGRLTRQIEKQLAYLVMRARLGKRLWWGASGRSGKALLELFPKIAMHLVPGGSLIAGGLEIMDAGSTGSTISDLLQEVRRTIRLTGLRTDAEADDELLSERRQHLRAAFDLLNSRGGGVPLVIVLDDAHDSDEPTLGFLAEILSASSGDLTFPDRHYFDVAEPPSDIPLLLIATSWTHRREEQLASGVGFGRWLKELEVTGIRHRELSEDGSMPPLTHEEASALYREHLPWITSAQLQPVLAHTPGDAISPFLAMLNVAQLSEGFPTPLARTSLTATWITQNLPRVPEDELRQRFMRLGENAQWAVTCGALVGREFPEHAVVRGLAGFERATPLLGACEPEPWAHALRAAAGATGYLSAPVKLTELPEPRYSNAFFAFDDDQAHVFACQRAEKLPWTRQAAAAGLADFLHGLMEAARDELAPGHQPAPRQIVNALARRFLDLRPDPADGELRAFALVLSGLPRMPTIDAAPRDPPRLAALQSLIVDDQHGIGFEYARYHLATWSLGRGQIDTAKGLLIGACDFLAGEAPRSRIAVQVARRLLTLDGVPEPTLVQLGEIAQMNAGTLHGDSLRADLFVARGQLLRAAEALGPHVATNQAAAMRVTNLLLRSNDRPAAIATLTPLVGQFEEAAVGLANVLVDMGDRPGALAALRPLAGRSDAVAIRLSELLVEAGDRDAAMAALEPLAGRTDHVAIRLAALLIEAGDRPAAVAALEALSGKSGQVAVRLADLLLETRDRLGAVAVLRPLAMRSELAAQKLADLLVESADRAGAAAVLMPLAQRSERVARRLVDLLVASGHRDEVANGLRALASVRHAAPRILLLSRGYEVSAETLEAARQCAEAFAEQDVDAAAALLLLEDSAEPSQGNMSFVRSHLREHRGELFSWMARDLWNVEDVTRILPDGSDLCLFQSFLWKQLAPTSSVPPASRWKWVGLHALLVQHHFPNYLPAAWSRLSPSAQDHPYCASVLGSIATTNEQRVHALQLLRPHVASGHKNCAIQFARLAKSLGARRLRDEARAALAVHAADSEEARELLAQLG